MKIAIIIPHYYESKVSKNALDSLVKQTKRDNLVIYIINDCSPNTDCEYSDLIDEYSPFLDIRYLKTKINSGGASIPRQLALDNSNEEYVLFLDQDDSLYDEFVIENYIRAIDKHIAEIRMKVMDYNIRIKNDSLMKGSLYSKEFLNRYNIRFNPKLNKCWEDFLFISEVNFYIDHSDYRVIELNKIAQIEYHTNLRTITTSNDYLTIIPYQLIYQSELIQFYKQHYNELSQDQKDYIIDILTAFYLNCYFFLEILKINNNINLYKSIIFLVDLINKNIKTIKKSLQQNSWYNEYRTDYFELNFNFFKQTLEKDWSNYEQIIQKNSLGRRY